MRRRLLRPLQETTGSVAVPEISGIDMPVMGGELSPRWPKPPRKRVLRHKAKKLDIRNVKPSTQTSPNDAYPSSEDPRMTSPGAWSQPGG